MQTLITLFSYRSPMALRDVLADKPSAAFRCKVARYLDALDTQDADAVTTAIGNGWPIKRVHTAMAREGGDNVPSLPMLYRHFDGSCPCRSA